MPQCDTFYECPCFLVNMSNSYLAYQFQTSFLLRQNQGLDPFPYSNCTSVFFFCYPELHYTFSFFDKLTATCFINLFAFNLYIIPLWEFSLNPSLASFTMSFFLSVQTGLYRARQTGLRLDEGHEPSTYAELVGRHLFIVHTLGSPDMVLISVKTFNSGSLLNHSCSLACRFS